MCALLSLSATSAANAAAVELSDESKRNSVARGSIATGAIAGGSLGAKVRVFLDFAVKYFGGDEPYWDT